MPGFIICIITFISQVECLGLSFNIGFVEYFGSTTSYSVLYGVVGGVATILLIVLIAGTVICVSKRRKAGPADIGGSMAMLELHSTGQIEGKFQVDGPLMRFAYILILHIGLHKWI